MAGLWQKTKLTFFWIICIAVFCILSLVAYAQWQQRPKPAVEFWDIKLTDTQDDVLFKKGQPTEKKGERWFYAQRDSEELTTGVFFRDKRIRVIAYSAPETYSSVSVQGVGPGSSNEVIEGRFGKCNEVKSSEDKLTRMYLYPRYNLFFVLEQNQVKVLGIYNPALGSPELTD